MKTWIVRLLLPAGLLTAFYATSMQDAQLKPWSVQMHVHASMSEGSGSWRGANVQARKIGLDVLWWSDHDWRMAYHTYIKGYDFEADGLEFETKVPYKPGTNMAEARQGERFQIFLSPADGNGSVTDTVGRISKDRAVNGTRSLEVAASAGAPRPAAAAKKNNARKKKGGDDEEGEGGGGRRRGPTSVGPYQPYLFTLNATRQTVKRSLASKVEVDISVYPEYDDPTAGMPAVRVDLSQQPPDMERGAIYYVATNLSDTELKIFETAHTKIVKLPFASGKWTRHTLHLTDDATRLGLGGVDNTMGAISFGVLTKGPRVHAYFDDFQIRHQYESEALRGEARTMAAALQKEFGVINYVGQELSYQAHMNPLGLNVPMIDYLKHPLGLSASDTSDFVHANGGILSLNHIFGTSRPPKDLDPSDPASVKAFEQKRIKELTESNVFGADMLEVGYPRRVLPMSSFLRVWDALAANGVYVLGNGISDTHTSNGGWFNANNFVSWVWAKSPSQENIIDAFRRGAMYFGNPVAFKGRLQLTTSDGHRMGQVVASTKPSHTVNIDIDGLPANTKVIAMVGGKKEKEFTATGKLQEKLQIQTDKRTWFRIEAYSAEGDPMLFSNPIWFAGSGESPKVAAERKSACR